MKKILIPLLTVLVATATTVASAQTSGFAYDDGYVQFHLENHDEHVDGVSVDTGWGLVSRGRVIGTGPRRNALLYKLSQNGTELGQIRCQTTRTRDYSPVEWHGVSNCHDDDLRIQVEGEVAVEVVFINGDTDEETVVANHRIEVLQATRVRRGGNPDSTRHYINHNGEVVRAIINRIPQGENGYSGGRRSGSSNRVELLMFAAPSERNRPGERSLSMTDPRELSLRCSVNGERLTIDRDRVSGGQDSQEIAFHTFGEGGRENQMAAHYSTIRYVLPIEWGDRRLGELPVLEEHPGNWQCMIRNAGQNVRTFSFVVNADGSIAPHAEEAAGLSIGLNAHFVDMSIEDSEIFETRVDPTAVARLGVGYGHVLTSAPSIAVVEALPTLGEATQPQPRPAQRRGRRSRRGRRGR